MTYYPPGTLIRAWNKENGEKVSWHLALEGFIASVEHGAIYHVYPPRVRNAGRTQQDIEDPSGFDFPMGMFLKTGRKFKMNFGDYVGLQFFAPD